MKTQDEILEFYELSKTKDFFGVTLHDILSRLTYDNAKQFLRPDATKEDWGEPVSQEKNFVLEELNNYMPFAWEKANNCRGLSAMRSILHIRNWLWFLGEDEACEELQDYEYYGKPQLRAVCEKFNIDWKSLDNGRWQNSEEGSYVSADAVDEIKLSWR